jgi:enoyl-CoA hydratase
MSGSVRLVRDGAIATIVLDRQANFNALARTDWEAIQDTVAAIETGDGIGCVIVRGAGGRAFSTGLDMSRFAAERSDSGQAKAYSEATARATGRLASLAQPSIAMIEGYCMGSGVDIACHCDLRIAADDAVFRISPKIIGLYLDRTFVEALVRVLGRARAMELVLEGRAYSAQKAHEIGLVNHLVPAAEIEARTMAIAADLAARYAAISSNRSTSTSP